MNTTANADAMTAILRQISLDWNRTISYGRSYIAIFFAYVPGFTCLMAATGSTLDSVAGAAIGGAASGFLMLNITLFSYEQMNNHHWMNGIVPINRNHQILGRFAFLIVCDLVAGLEVAVSIACAGIIMHEPVKVTDAIGFAAMTVLTLVLLNAIVQPFLYRFSPYRAMAAIILSIGVIGGRGHRTVQGVAGTRKDRRTAGRGDQPAPSHCVSGILDHRRTRLGILPQNIAAYLRQQGHLNRASW